MIMCTKENWYFCSDGNCQKCFCLPLGIVLRSKFFPLVFTPFLKGFCFQKSKHESTEVILPVKIAEKPSKCISFPCWEITNTSGLILFLLLIQCFAIIFNCVTWKYTMVCPTETKINLELRLNRYHAFSGTKQNLHCIQMNYISAIFS